MVASPAGLDHHNLRFVGFCMVARSPKIPYASLLDETLT